MSLLSKARDFSSWADQFYKRQREKGKSHHSAIRSLAFKWIRIIFACWKANKPYDESLYINAVAKRNSPRISMASPWEYFSVIPANDFSEESVAESN